MYSEWAEDEIRIEMLKVYARHGVFREETENGQDFYINAILYTDTSRAGRSDDLKESIDYGEVCKFLTEWMKNNTCLLLETVAERLAEAVLLRYPLAAALELEIRKPDAPIPLPFGCVSVKIRRGWHRAYIGIGSNMGDRRKYMDSAVEALKAHPLIKLGKVSEYIVTSPYGGVEQEDFLNGALELETLLNPQELLEALHEIEAAADRKRTIHWGPRTLDLDILFYDNICYLSDSLIIPHPDMENRSFVLQPLLEIAPYLRHPGNGKTVREMEQALEESRKAEQR